MTTNATGNQTSDPVSTGPESNSRTHDAVAAGIGAIALALLIGAPWLVDTAGPDPFYKGPLIFPLIALALTVLGALPAAGRLMTNRSGASWFVDGHGVPWTAIGVFVLMCLFPVAIRFAGLGAAAFIFVFAGLMVSGYRRPVRAVTIAALVAACLHLAFITFLDIWFPTPLLVEWYEG
jgi:hypothetical protein